MSFKHFCKRFFICFYLLIAEHNNLRPKLIVSLIHPVLCFREIVKLLLEHDASPNIVDSKGSSPLHLAAWSGNVDIVRLLLSGPSICNVNLTVTTYIHIQGGTE